MSLDDRCHLAPYAVKYVVTKHNTELTRYFAERKMAVDFLHFKVRHMHSYCAMCELIFDHLVRKHGCIFLKNLSLLPPWEKQAWEAISSGYSFDN